MLVDWIGYVTAGVTALAVVGLVALVVDLEFRKMRATMREERDRDRLLPGAGRCDRCGGRGWVLANGHTMHPEIDSRGPVRCPRDCNDCGADQWRDA